MLDSFVLDEIDIVDSPLISRKCSIHLGPMGEQRAIPNQLPG